MDRLFSLYHDAVQQLVSGLAWTWIPQHVVYRISIFLLAVDLLQDFWMEPLTAIDMEFVILLSLVAASICFSLSFLVASLSSSSSSDNDSSAAVALAGMVSLFLVELLVPVTMIGGTVMCCLGYVTGETAFVLILAVWITSTYSSDIVRQTVYPSLGHG